MVRSVHILLSAVVKQMPWQMYAQRFGDLHPHSCNTALALPNVCVCVCVCERVGRRETHTGTQTGEGDKKEQVANTSIISGSFD